jgi:hypothetical protein
MKTFQFYGLLLAISTVAFFSCQKNGQSMTGEPSTDDLQTCAGTNGGGNEGGGNGFGNGGGGGNRGGGGSSTNSGGGSTGTLVTGDQNNIPSSLEFCNPKTVTLCTQQGNVGSVTVRRGFDDKIYVTYSLAANYFFTELKMFTGTAASIPVNNNRVDICDFPYRKSFGAPYNVHQYTFVLRDEPETFNVAAYAAVVKIVNHSVRQVAEAWGDGCDGQRITSGGNRSSYESYNLLDCKGANWATRFDYASGPCVIAATASEPEGLCSKAIACFFGINPLYNTIVGWPVETVDVAGHTYTEAEARAIADAPDVNGVCPDSKYALMRVATLKLSNTDWSSSPTLNVAVTTMENYLSTAGKISPSHMPTGNAAARSAAETVNTWIDNNNCPERR